ncbi:MAG: FtsX-like permease family protein, partial [Bryobacteraceae bacterium]
LMRAAAKGEAELIAVSYVERMELTYRSAEEREKAAVQYVSGWMFPSFDLHPAVGRLLTENDDRKRGAHPYAVLSHDYWLRRFGADGRVVGRTFRLGETLYEIVGVTAGPFSGTAPGTMVDIFVPTMMHAGVPHADWTWFRTLAMIRPGANVETLRAKLDATSRAFEQERAKGFGGMTRQNVERFVNQTLLLGPARSGASGLQTDYREALAALGVLVGLVLLIACANVANLRTGQAAARAREMALRVSIGAGRWRLIQMVLVESVLLAVMAAAVGAMLAWWSAPFVVSHIKPPDDPARLFLSTDWRVVGFLLALTLGVTCLFGLAPAVRASGVKPASALKGGEDPHSRRRLMHALIAAQVAFCFMVVFVASLFAATFVRLSSRPMGFSTERLLVLDTVAARAEKTVSWNQVAEHLRTVPGVDGVALCGWPLLGGNAWNGFVSVGGAPAGAESGYFLSVSPGWMETMKMRLIDGRDFREEEMTPGSAIVNETFVKTFLKAKTVGARFARGTDQFEVVGVVRDAPYRTLRGPILPVAYFPFRTEKAIRDATILVRTVSKDPLSMGAVLRREVPYGRSGFRVSNIRTHEELVLAQTVRERLLATLGLFFAAVALLLAGIGLYGVLDYSVLQRRREIGIRMAIGAPAGEIAWRVTREVFAMVVVGSVAGVVLGLAGARSIEALLYGVMGTDVGAVVAPVATILAVAAVAAAPGVIRAVRIDPVAALRAD